MRLFLILHAVKIACDAWKKETAKALPTADRLVPKFGTHFGRKMWDFRDKRQLYAEQIYIFGCLYGGLRCWKFNALRFRREACARVKTILESLYWLKKFVCSEIGALFSLAYSRCFIATWAPLVAAKLPGPPDAIKKGLLRNDLFDLIEKFETFYKTLGSRKFLQNKSPEGEGRKKSIANTDQD